MRSLILVVNTLLIVGGVGSDLHGHPRTVVPAQPGSPSGQTAPATPLSPEALDRLLAPIALYPDQLLAQMLLCAMDPSGVTALDRFLKGHSTLKGTELQDAALKDNFEPSFVAMALFPQVISAMAADLNSTTRIGQAFTADKTAVFASIQRLRKQAHDAGNLKSTPQQEVGTQTTSAGQQVIVIEPANPQVVYVPQYNSQTVYVEDDDDTDAIVAGVMGFTAGVAIGAAINNNYYYGPYGWHGGAYMYNDAWDDYYDHREDAREDWTDHREDIMEERGDRREDVAEQRGDRAGTTQEQRTERQQNRTETRSGSEQQRTERQQTRQENRPSGAQAATTSTSSTHARGSGSYESRGRTQSQTQTAKQDRSGSRSDAFSGYSSGKSQRAASSRGSSSRASARGSRGGGGRRR